MSQSSAKTKKRGRERLPWGSLGADVILDAALALLDERGPDALTTPALGRALGADPSAVYRHFASKDDLLVALHGRLLQEALEGIEPQRCWVETLADVIRRCYRMGTRHPAALALVSTRVTGLAVELRAVEIILSALRQAGFDGPQAALCFRAVADFMFAIADDHASYLALPPEAQARDDAAREAYAQADSDTHPHLAALGAHVAQTEDVDAFETAASLLLHGLLAVAPQPCDCKTHTLRLLTAA